MLYAILCYNSEAEANAWSKAQDDAVLAKRAKVTDKLAAKGMVDEIGALEIRPLRLFRPGAPVKAMEGTKVHA